MQPGMASMWLSCGCVGVFPFFLIRDATKSILERDDQTMRQELLDRLVDQKLTGPILQIGNDDPKTLVTRELPHGNVANLYLMYIAYCKTSGETPASRACFYNTSKRWKCCLTFHKPSNHSKCWTCSRLQAAISNASVPWWGSVNHILLKCCFYEIGLELSRGCFFFMMAFPQLKDFVEHARLSDSLLAHYTQTWRDRECYWLSRSRSRIQKDLVTMIIDSYDKSKCLLPKFPKGRSPKRPLYDRLHRFLTTNPAWFVFECC